MRVQKGAYAYVSKKGRFISPEQIDRMIDLMKEVSAREGITSILIGGVAMQSYGSPRLTKDIDFAVDSEIPKPEGFTFLGPINFGGSAFIAPDGAKMDVILRNDEYKNLYDEALQHLVVTEDGIPIASPDYLAAMEFAANDPKHTLDLKWLIKQPRLLDLQQVKNIIYRHIGQKFGVETFDRLVDQVEHEQRMRPSTDPTEYP